MVCLKISVTSRSDIDILSEDQSLVHQTTPRDDHPVTVPDFPYFVFSAREVVGCYILHKTCVVVLYETTTIDV